jgi:3-oxoacyl-[acyl-carrier protein] reductase
LENGSRQGRNPKVAVVTGASKGIGVAIAKALGKEGASVVVNYASSTSGADGGVDAIVKAGGKAIAVRGDVSKATDAAIQNFGRLDILVNNSGIYEFARVNSVNPGFTLTDGTNSYLGSEFVNGLVAQISLGRAGQPEEIAAIVTFLASIHAWR